MGGKVSLHHNMIYFDGVEVVQWEEKVHSITQGQPYKGSFAKHDIDGACLDVVAGRHGSQVPAEEFKSGMQVVNMIASTSHSWKEVIEPNLMNFAVVGTAIFTIKGVEYECKDLRIGQGHFGSTNNWWIGAPNCFGSSSAYGTLTCLAFDGSYLASCGLTFHSRKSDHFHVEYLGPMATDTDIPRNLTVEYMERDIVEPSANDIAGGAFFNVRMVVGVAATLASLFALGFTLGKWRKKLRFSDESVGLMADTGDRP